MNPKIIHPICRFCRKVLSVEIPDERRMPNADPDLVRNLSKLIAELASKVCCNRCADYHRDQGDRADTLQRLALSLTHATGKEADVIRASIRAVCSRVIVKAEDFHLISGLSDSAGDFAQLVFDQPAYARDHVRKFMREAEAMAKRAHKPETQQEAEYAY